MVKICLTAGASAIVEVTVSDAKYCRRASYFNKVLNSVTYQLVFKGVF